MVKYCFLTHAHSQNHTYGIISKGRYLPGPIYRINVHGGRNIAYCKDQNKPCSNGLNIVPFFIVIMLPQFPIVHVK